MTLEPPAPPSSGRVPSGAAGVLVLSLLLSCLGVVAVAVVRGADAVVGLQGGAGAAYPPLPESVSVVPLGQPLPAPAGEGGFAALQHQPGTGEPVGWDPCRPIRYVVNAAHAPTGADYLLSDALAELQRVTGQVFVAEGPTDEQPSETRQPVQRDRYGDRWAPVLVAWSEPSAAPMLAGAVAGYAGAQAVDGADPDTVRYVTGSVVLDGPQLAELAAGPAGIARARGVLLHELAHLLGLDHVDDANQLMYPSTTMLGVDFADGDLRGLAAVSGKACYRDW